MHLFKTWRTMEAPLRHINCRSLTLESANKWTYMSSRIQDTTYFAVFLQIIQGSNPAICYFNTEGRLDRTSLIQMHYTAKCFNWWVERQRYSIHQQFGIHNTSMKPITIEASNKQIDGEAHIILLSHLLMKKKTLLPIIGYIASIKFHCYSYWM